MFARKGGRLAIDHENDFATWIEVTVDFDHLVQLSHGFVSMSEDLDHSPEWGDVLDRTDDLDARVNASTQITDLVLASRRNRTLIRITLASVFLDIALSIALGIVAIQAQNAANLANVTTHHEAFLTCQALNRVNAEQITLWEQFPPPDPHFLPYVRALYAPQQCSP